jgi:2,3-bisphosphoglycerate-dependent phosphoglycerate mutase
MELYIIRHGQSTNNLTMMYDAADREPDPPLTEVGRKQAQAVARYLASAHNIDVWVERPPEQRQALFEQRISRLYCSPMRRALQTCQPIAEALKLVPEVWPEIHEHGGLHLGSDESAQIFPGLTRAEMQAAFPGCILPPSITEQGWYDVRQGVEDIHGCMARALRVAAALRDQAATDERIALITHGTFAGCLLKAFFNLLPADELRFLLYNTAITRLDFYSDGRVALRYANRVDHLPPELLT